MLKCFNRTLLYQ